MTTFYNISVNNLFLLLLQLFFLPLSFLFSLYSTANLSEQTFTTTDQKAILPAVL